MAELLWKLDDVVLAGDTSPRLDGVSLEIPSGVTAVIGYSGAGKTSLLNVLAGMDLPDAGRVECRFANSAASDFAVPLFWSPQDSGLWPHISVRNHIVSVMAENGGKLGDPSEFADKMLADFDLIHRQHAFPGELSRGEQSRLAIARALAANPAVLLMDEPLAHVDPVRTPQYWSLICEHLKNTRASLVFSTHDPSAAIRESESVVCLNAGQVKFMGATKRLYLDPPDEDVARFLGPINWFTADETVSWLNNSSLSKNQPSANKDQGIRPENIQLAENAEGPFQILSFRFCGSYSEARLKHLPTSTTKTILHRPSANAHHDGQTVNLEILP